MGTQKFVVRSPERVFIEKDPQAVLDYTFLWSEWLPSGDTIQSHSTIIESGTGEVFSATVDRGNTVVAWVRGGTVGETMKLRCRISTAGGRIEDRSVYIKIRDQ